MRRLGCAALIVLVAFGVLVATRVRFVGPEQGRAVVATSPVKASGAVWAPAARPSDPPPGLLSVPVAGVERASIQDSWLDPREGGARQHHGTDIPAPAGTIVTAAGPGTVAKLFQSGQGGTTLYERSADGRWVYYYAHLSGYVPGTHEGQSVRAGDPLAYVGDTGDAGPGNYHLHFGLTRVQAGEQWWQGEDVNPYPLLAGKRVAR